MRKYKKIPIPGLHARRAVPKIAQYPREHMVQACIAVREWQNSYTSSNKVKLDQLGLIYNHWPECAHALIILLIAPSQ